MPQIASSTLEPPFSGMRVAGSHSPRTVKKADIAKSIRNRMPSVSIAQAATLIDAALEEIAIAMAADEPLRLDNFGLFVVRRKRERPGRNPKSGALAPVKPRRVVVFKASTKLKLAVANGSIVEST